MKKELYDTLSVKEKLIYDEFSDFSLKMAARLDALTLAIKRLVEVATQDP